ncbi:ead/Ea22-like family protein [Klebsiella pneumoniae]|uniref:ead/Ea22-like family protein n=1 Tax=Klebsiella pneumoniae complex TaxID=3390273 RepID=UPI0013EF754F|nr:ead/Ea22-like family protein [Klebsiella quasipneumoniae]
MNDITELAQRARINAECGEHLSPAETIELVEALEKAQQRIAELEESHAQVIQSRDHYKRMSEEGLKQLAEYCTVNPEDTDGVREEDNKFLVIRHPGKVPVIKHPVGKLEDYLLQILQADPLATIDIVTHRYYGVGGQFVEDADEYLHEMGIKWEAE